MNRGEGEVKECQGVEEREIKRSITEEESAEPSDLNPFLVEPILRKLLKKVDTVAQLKDLRKICLLWDKVNIEELEERAFQGKIKIIDFQWTDRFTTKEGAEKELVDFLEDTQKIPQLFRSFKFDIESLKVLQNHIIFFSDYNISRAEFVMSFLNFIECQVPMKYFLSLIGANLKEIQMPHINIHNKISFEPKTPNWPNLEQELLLPNLEKLVIGIRSWDQLADLFKSALRTSHITSLKLATLPDADIGSFPGLDPARMTRLDILEGFQGSSIALKFTTGLMTLVEKGMRLKDLGLRFGSGGDNPASFTQNLPRLCSNITHFFSTQSSTLTTLDLQLKLFVFWPRSEEEIGAEVASYGKIQLPVFKALHTLSFDHRLKFVEANQDRTIHVFSLFEAANSLPLHFPFLINVTFESECSMGFFFDHPGQLGLAGDSRFQFKRLEIIKIYTGSLYFLNSKSRGNWKKIYEALIESVNYLSVPSDFLKQRIPWTDLCELVIKPVTPLKLVHLKLAHLQKLKTLTIVENERRIGSEKILLNGGALDEADSDDEIWQESISEYLNWFAEAIGLSLTYIKFIGLEFVERGVKEEFVRYFPYPVIFDKGERYL